LRDFVKDLRIEAFRQGDAGVGIGRGDRFFSGVSSRERSGEKAGEDERAGAAIHLGRMSEAEPVSNSVRIWRKLSPSVKIADQLPP
jgi:hypothetical protein